jgi:hypothetical protein
MMTGMLVLACVPAAQADCAEKHGQIRSGALDTLYSSYLGIQRSLARDDLAGAKKASDAFLVKPPDLPAELSHSVDAKEVLKDLRAIHSAENLPSARKAFLGLSERMVLVMSESKYAGEDSALVFFCPMTNEGKGGRWLQDSRKLANPYYGKSMLTCGSLKTRISPPPEKRP